MGMIKHKDLQPGCWYWVRRKGSLMAFIVWIRVSSGKKVYTIGSVDGESLDDFDFIKRIEQLVECEWCANGLVHGNLDGSGEMVTCPNCNGTGYIESEEE